MYVCFEYHILFIAHHAAIIYTTSNIPPNISPIPLSPPIFYTACFSVTLNNTLFLVLFASHKLANVSAISYKERTANIIIAIKRIAVSIHFIVDMMLRIL